MRRASAAEQREGPLHNYSTSLGTARMANAGPEDDAPASTATRLTSPGLDSTLVHTFATHTISARLASS